MKATLYMEKIDGPVSVLDEVQIVEMDKPNHLENSQYRIFFKTASLNATKTMVELHRDRKMMVKLEDGRTADALLTHSSFDLEGKAVGVLRVLGEIA